jgi:hypothetical protein
MGILKFLCRTGAINLLTICGIIGAGYGVGAGSNAAIHGSRGYDRHDSNSDYINSRMREEYNSDSNYMTDRIRREIRVVE